MGATLREVIFDIGGGMLPGREFKAVQLGGPRGGCLPAELLDTPIDFENLTELRLHDGLRRHGRRRRHDLHGRLRQVLLRVHRPGELRQVRTLPRRHAAHARDPRAHHRRRWARIDDVELLEQLSDDIIEGSLCQLGGSAPNPVLTTLRYFRDEVMAHVVEKRCPAKVCRPLIRYIIDERRLHRLPRLPRGLPHAGDQRRAQAAARDRPEALHQVRHLSPGVQVRRRPCRDAATGAGRREAAVSPRDQDCRQAHHRRPLSSPPARARPCSRWRGARGSTSPRSATSGGHGRLGRLPPVPGRGRRPRQAAGGLHHVGQGRPGRARPTRRACARGARATSRCTSRTTTPTVRRRARTRARRTSTSPAYMAALAAGDAAGAAAHRARRAALPRHPRPRLPALLRARLPPRRRRRAHRHLRPAPGGRRPQPASARAPGAPTGQRVAVIGAGPAGLSAAWFLTQRAATQVTIYDANEKPGGIAALQHPRVPPAREGRREGARAALGGRRALRRRVRAGLRGRPRRACSTPASTPCSSASAPGAERATSPGRRGRAQRPRVPARAARRQEAAPEFTRRSS